MFDTDNELSEFVSLMPILSNDNSYADDCVQHFGKMAGSNAIICLHQLMVQPIK